MKFHLVDRIHELVPGQRIRTSKVLTLSEEYLADHFPTFPVMPGVLMLETLAQSAAWLVRASEDFKHSIVVLESARNVTYKNFVAPGRCLDIEVTADRIGPDASDFRGLGRCDDKEMVKARFTLQHLNLADQDASLADLDRRLIDQARDHFELIAGSSGGVTATAAAE